MESNTTTTTTGTGYYYRDPCASKLPCGYCMLLNRPCPMQTNSFISPSWDPNQYKITCNTEETNG